MEDLSYLEGVAEQALSLANDDAQSFVEMLNVARALGLSVEWAPACEIRRRGKACINGSQIRVRTGLDAIEERFAIAHEIGHFLLGDRRHEEADADFVAASLVIPRRALACARRYLGDDLEALACAFQASQTSMVLRLAECGAVDAAAVIEPKIVRVRASVEFSFPDDSVLRKLAKCDQLGERVRRSTLTDDARRVALIVEQG